MIRVFLDANVLFSAAWREDAGIGALWDRQDVHLVTSSYALREAERNIQSKKPAAVARLSQLASKVDVSTATGAMGEDHGLPEKDRPILEAAAASDCSILLTGDVTHFGHLFGKEAEGVRVLTVSTFLAILATSAQEENG